MTFSSFRRSWYSRSISLCIMVTFVSTMVVTPRASYAGGVLGLPQPGTMVSLSSSYVPLMITGLTVHPENPLLMDFIVSTGNSGMSAAQVKEESSRLIKYFLACLTIPENDQWVNLSPYEKKHIVPEDLGQTVLGQDMLAQDYLLKQLTASLIYPEKNLGRSFWDKVYARADQMYGTSQIPVNTFNKVWILPDTAKVFEHKDTVFVVKSHLKVMLDEDYLALQKHSVIASEAKQSFSRVNNLGNQVVRQIILPAIEQEVNTGKNFAQMRQIYNSMILAVWFKKNLKQALLNQVYTDKAKVNGVNGDDPAIKDKIYRQYLEAYKKGVFNYIKEEVDQNTRETIPRKYFSGGLTAFREKDLAMATPEETESALGSSLGEYYNIRGLAQEAPDKAMIISTLRAKGIPEIVLQNIEQGIITNEEHLRILSILADIGEQGLLAQWNAPGVNDKQKRAFLDQMEALDKGYAGGLIGYKNNAKELLTASLQGKSAFEGFIPSVPQGDQFTQIDNNYENMENEGLKAFNKTAAVLVAGGVGDRLGFNGIKVGIPLDLVSMHTYLQHYIESILAFQEKSNEMNHEHRLVPLVIMTSDDTHRQTIRLLEDNNYFGMDGLSINPTHEQVIHGDIKQIVILKQGMVPAMVDNDAKFVLDGNDHYKLQTKPHGHGDVHMLIKQAGLDELWLKEGRTHTFFFQDTNGQVFNAILVGLANSIRKKFALNFLTVPREAKEKTGAIVHMKNKDGRDQTFNVEYNELDPFLRATVNPDGDAADPQTGKSSYPANLNVFIVENVTYHLKLNATGGIFGEFINPKYADSTKMRFLAPTRSETMMQDYAKSLPGEMVGFTNFDKRDVFSPVKNDVAGALTTAKNGNYPDSMATGESDFYKANRARFALAGVKVDVQGQEIKSRGVHFNDGAKIVYSPLFASDVKELKQKVKGGSISSRSVLSIDGENVILNNLHLDGSLFIKTAPRVSLTINDWEDVNAGTELVNLTESELNDPSVPQYLKIRGYKLVQRDAKVIDIQEPGDYEIGYDGQLRRLDAAMNSASPWRVEKDSGVANGVRSLVLTNGEKERKVTLILTQNNVYPIIDNTPLSQPYSSAILSYPAQRIIDIFGDNDQAMTAALPAALANPGGIDLNSRNLSLESSGQKVDITFNPAMIVQFKRGDFSGVKFQILDVVPINLMPLLGLREDN